MFDANFSCISVTLWHDRCFAHSEIDSKIKKFIKVIFVTIGKMVPVLVRAMERSKNWSMIFLHVDIRTLSHHKLCINYGKNICYFQ